jgi:hypothetical protein
MFWSGNEAMMQWTSFFRLGSYLRYDQSVNGPSCMTLASCMCKIDDISHPT